MAGFLGDMGGVALITGAGSGMGRACAVTFATAGSKVVLVDLNEAGLKETLAMLPAGAVAKIITLNICDDDALIAMIQGIPQDPKFGRLDYALNCAGVLGKVRGPFASSELKDDEFIMNVNMRAQSIMIREEVKIMLAQKPRPESPNTQGAIVNWASWVSFHGSATSWAYSASKHAVVAMTKSATLGHAAQGIRCNAVAPGVMNTPLIAGANQAFLDSMVKLVPAKRLGESNEVADLALFLCSNKSSYINGAVINIDGGWHAA
ncbi:hypothetical protein RQP46_011489 [Phenoliferia psychrophenolica]